ncbi:MAG: hypothetical protein JXR83_13390, partial [Deltaproteobacteria bacterium]|nr:hypothetical protein [Deltaproteobacteria bacterium]
AAIGVGSTRRLAASALAMAALLLLAAALWPGLRAPLADAWSVLLNRDLTYRLPLESRSPLFSEDWFTLDALVADYTYLGVLLPLVWGALAVTAIRRRDGRAGTLLLVIFGGLGLALQLIQRRFVEYSAAAFCLLLAWALVGGGRWLRRQVAASARPWRTGLLAAALVAALLAAASPAATAWPGIVGTDLTWPQRQLRTLARELLPLLPPAVDRDGAPAYGILSGWNDAHPLLYATGRATMVTTFGTREAFSANAVGFAILLSPSEPWAVRQLQAHRLRYLVLSSPVGQIASMVPLAALPLPELEHLSSGRDGEVRSQLLPGYAATLHGRLFLGDGAATPAGTYRPAPLGHFRLLLESGARTAIGDIELASQKVFEVVAGARLVGRADAGATCSVALELRTNRDRPLRYAVEITADAGGKFEAVVPYPTAAWGAPVIPLGRYQITCGLRRAEVEVSETQVQTGAEVVVM